jgi:hypothetical protein
MFDLNVSRLALAFQNCTGHEHRIQPIAVRAATILSERLSELYPAADPTPRTRHIDVVSAPTLSLDLRNTSDEQAATQIAGAWFEALALHLQE